MTGPSTPRTFRAGIVGAGLISDHHAETINALDGVDLVGVHDLDAARAADRAAAWSTRAFPSLAAMVEAGVDVVHVLTPPQSHAELALEALGLGCHVLVEKPMADSAEDARKVTELAASLGLVVTVDHSLLHDPQVLRALDLVRTGAIGQVVGLDVFRSQAYPAYAGGPPLPHMSSAGYPWRDVGIHCLYLAEAFLGQVEDVEARWTGLGGEPDLAFDEWAAVVTCRDGLARCQLSWNSRPLRSELVVHGTRGTIRCDLFAMFTSLRRHTPLPKAVERVVNAYADALAPLGQVPVSSWRFVRGRTRPYQAVRSSVADFYDRLGAGLPPAVRGEDAAALVELVERTARAADADHAERVAALPRSARAQVLVTGASGSIGAAVVARLVAQGRSVRVLLRRPPVSPLPGVDHVIGDLGDAEAVDRAVSGVEVVIHAGAALNGPWERHQAATVLGTRHVVAACRRHGVRQLVHLSSLSVLDLVGAEASGRPVTETTPLEPHPERRGSYTAAKLAAERTVTEAAADGLPAVVLRPGSVVGGSLPLVSPSVARCAGRRWFAIGSPDVRLPLVHLDDVVDAVLAAVERRLTSGEVVHVVDDPLTRREVLALARETGQDLDVVQVPRPAALGLGWLSERAAALLGRHSPLAPYRLRAATPDTSFCSQRVEELLDWRPRVGVRDGVRRASPPVS